MIGESAQALRHVCIKIRRCCSRVFEITVAAGDFDLPAVSRDPGEAKQSRTPLEIVGGAAPNLAVIISGRAIDVGDQFVSAVPEF